MDWSQGTPPATRSAHREVLPLLRVVGQVGLTYIIAEGPDGMYLIDQHAAHERVVYDRIVAQRAAAGAPATQPLLEPELLELDALQAATAAEYADHLAGLGLGLEPFGERGYLVRAVPAGVGGTGVVSALRSLLDQLAGERRVADPFARAAGPPPPLPATAASAPGRPWRWKRCGRLSRISPAPGRREPALMGVRRWFTSAQMPSRDSSDAAETGPAQSCIACQRKRFASATPARAIEGKVAIPARQQSS
ncbi:MAG: hypothetical protein DYG91_11830 [Chloroflexi bacterium CFX7]|nr:hypothetical protein [Chloroflexi bacterium CFX7]